MWGYFDEVLDLGQFGADPQKSFTNGLRESLQNTITKTVNYDLLKGKTLPDRYEILGGLKKTNPQAYFYWVLALEE